MLKALDTIGCGDDIVSQGTKATKVEIGTRSGVLANPDVAYLKRYTRHPYTVVIPQNLTEHVLGTKLASFGVSVHRPLKVVGMKRNTENAQLTDVAFEDGRVITAKYVVGADGARSVVSLLLLMLDVILLTAEPRFVPPLVSVSLIQCVNRQKRRAASRR